jgi:hypothetical protein
MFTCEQCGYSTKVKCNLTKHLNRKTKCGPIDVANVTIGLTNIAVERTNIAVERTNVAVERTNVAVERTNVDVEKHSVDVENVPVEQTNIKNKNRTVNFGNENFDYLTLFDDTGMKMITACIDVDHLIELMFFNSDHPENQTIRKLGMDDTMEFRENNKWKPECDSKGLSILRNRIDQWVMGVNINNVYYNHKLKQVCVEHNHPEQNLTTNDCFC